MLCWLILIGAITLSACHPRHAADIAPCPKPLTVVVLGDSNGASDVGWVVQTQAMKPDWHLLNHSIPGNTIGFDNLDNPRLNTLRNLEDYLTKAREAADQPIDYVLIALGTNDCKAVFKDQGDEVRDNLRTLIQRIRDFDFEQERPPAIAVLSPPPVAGDDRVAAKYQGAADRVRALQADFQRIAGEMDCLYIDAYSPLADHFDQLTRDGVHLAAEGHTLVADVLIDDLSQHVLTCETSHD